MSSTGLSRQLEKQMNPETQAKYDFMRLGSNENPYSGSSESHAKYEKQWEIEVDSWLIQDFKEQQGEIHDRC